MNPNKMERKFYQAWISMRFRCSKNVKGNAKKQYFDRGITVCNRWENFDYFFIDMWKEYLSHYNINGKNTELDRINNNNGYSKKNCRWVVHRINSNNRSSMRLFNGKTLTSWSEILGMKRSTLAQRFYVYNWTVNKTLHC